MQVCRGDGGALTFCLLLSATAATFTICSCAASSSAETTTLTSFDSQSGEMAKIKNNTIEERSVIGDIEKLKKVGEILQTVAEKIIPVLIENPSPTASNDSLQEKSKGLQLIHGLKKEVDELAKIKN